MTSLLYTLNLFWVWNNFVGATRFFSHLIWLFASRWWAPSKFDPVKSPMLFFENGLPLIPALPPHVGLDLVLKHMVWRLPVCFSRFWLWYKMKTLLNRLFTLDMVKFVWPVDVKTPDPNTHFQVVAECGDCFATTIL